jgi:RNA polymerase sigma-70 factor (ECF subfamily)
MTGRTGRPAPPAGGSDESRARPWADGPAAGLTLVEAVGADGSLAGYHHYHAVRADLLRRLGRRSQAAAAYERAVALAGNDAERSFLLRRLGEVRSAG